jgi:Tfp pilus assembly protein FimT
MPNSGSTRREPGFKGKGFSAQAGVTIIEVLLVTSILVVVAATLLPMKKLASHQQQLVDSANTLTEFLATARLEANIRQEETTMSYRQTGETEWCLGYVRGEADCDCFESNLASPTACVVDSALRVFGPSDLPDPSVFDDLVGDGTYVFHPSRGLSYDASGRRIFDQAAVSLKSSDQSVGLSVQISPTGSISTCSHRGKALVPGYRECLNALR